MTDKQYPINGYVSASEPLTVEDQPSVEFPPAATLAIEITQAEVGGWVIWVVNTAKTFRLAIGYQTDLAELARIVRHSTSRIDQMKKDEGLA